MKSKNAFETALKGGGKEILVNSGFWEAQGVRVVELMFTSEYVFM